MMDQTVTITAHTLEEAREQVRPMVPRGLAIVAEELEAEGELKEIRAASEQAEAAMARALREVPPEAQVVSKKEVIAAHRETIEFQAHSEAEVRKRMQARLRKTQVLEAVHAKVPPKRGILGVGRQPGVYEAVVLQHAVVEVAYRLKSRYHFTIGPQRVYRHVATWGGYGLTPGKFYSPQGIATDSQGHLYVTDNGVQLDEQGNVGGRFSHVIQMDRQGNWLTVWGEHGPQQGQMLEAQSIDVDNQGNVYVADARAGRIIKFDTAGRFISEWGRLAPEGQFNPAEGSFFSGGTLHLAVAPSGDVYVSDLLASRILRFDSSGQFVAAWGSAGKGEGQFERPEGLAVDSQGYVYVADGGNDRVQKFTADGEFVSQWGSRGYEPGQFAAPRGVAVDIADCVYVSSAGIPLQKFTPEGEFLAALPTPPAPRMKVQRFEDVAVDGDGAVYLLEFNNKVVYQFG